MAEGEPGAREAAEHPHSWHKGRTEGVKTTACPARCKTSRGSSSTHLAARMVPGSKPPHQCMSICGCPTWSSPGIHADARVLKRLETLCRPVGWRTADWIATTV